MKPFKKVVYLTTLSFTWITYLLMLLNNSMNLLTGGIKFDSVNRVLIFSVVLGLAGLLFEIKKLSYGIARAVHFIVLCLDFAFVIAPVRFGSEFRMIFLAVLVFAVVYWIIIVLIALVHWLVSLIAPFFKNEDKKSNNKKSNKK